MAIAIIPARGGSKRILRKNIRPFCGQPMLAYAILAAQAAGCFSHIVVSTDDEEIAEVARQWGAEVPFMRSASLADDHTGTTPVVIDAIRRLDELGLMAEHYCNIYATVPLIQASDLNNAYQRLLASQAPFIYTVAEFGFPIQRAVRMDEQGRVSPFWPEQMAKRSQDLEAAYQDAGQFYWGSRDAWLAGVSPVGGEVIGYLLPRHRVVDIDTPEDWHLAELLYRVLNQNGA